MPKFCEILEEARSIALDWDATEIVVAIDADTRPHPRQWRTWNTVIDRAYKNLWEREKAIQQLTKPQ